MNWNAGALSKPKLTPSTLKWFDQSLKSSNAAPSQKWPGNFFPGPNCPPRASKLENGLFNMNWCPLRAGVVRLYSPSLFIISITFTFHKIITLLLLLLLKLSLLFKHYRNGNSCHSLDCLCSKFGAHWTCGTAILPDATSSYDRVGAWNVDAEMSEQMVQFLVYHGKSRLSVGQPGRRRGSLRRSDMPIQPCSAEIKSAGRCRQFCDLFLRFWSAALRGPERRLRFLSAWRMKASDWLTSLIEEIPRRAGFAVITGSAEYSLCDHFLCANALPLKKSSRTGNCCTVVVIARCHTYPPTVQRNAKKQTPLFAPSTRPPYFLAKFCLCRHPSSPKPWFWKHSHSCGLRDCLVNREPTKLFYSHVWCSRISRLHDWASGTVRNWSAVASGWFWLDEAGEPALWWWLFSASWGGLEGVHGHQNNVVGCHTWAKKKLCRGEYNDRLYCRCSSSGSSSSISSSITIVVGVADRKSSAMGMHT